MLSTSDTHKTWLKFQNDEISSKLIKTSMSVHIPNHRGWVHQNTHDKNKSATLPSNCKRREKMQVLSIWWKKKKKEFE